MNSYQNCGWKLICTKFIYEAVTAELGSDLAVLLRLLQSVWKQNRFCVLYFLVIAQGPSSLLRFACHSLSLVSNFEAFVCVFYNWNMAQNSIAVITFTQPFWEMSQVVIYALLHLRLFRFFFLITFLVFCSARNGNFLIVWTPCLELPHSNIGELKWKRQGVYHSSTVTLRIFLSNQEGCHLLAMH